METSHENEDAFIQELNSLIITAHRGEDLIYPLTKINNNLYMGQGRTTLYGGMLTQLGITHVLSIGRTPHGSVKNGKFEKLEILEVPDAPNVDIARHFPMCF